MSVHIKYKEVYLKYEDITDTIRPKQSVIEAKLEQFEHLKQEENAKVKIMNRKEISNVKSLSPWRKTNSLFFKKRKF